MRLSTRYRYVGGVLTLICVLSLISCGASNPNNTDDGTTSASEPAAEVAPKEPACGEDAKDDLDVYGAKLSEIGPKITTLEGEVSDLNTSITSKSNRIEEIDNQFLLHNQQVEYYGRADLTPDRINDLEKERDRLDREIIGLRGQLSGKETQLSNKQSTAQDYQSTIDSANLVLANCALPQ